jgi:hypothetical protein
MSAPTTEPFTGIRDRVPHLTVLFAATGILLVVAVGAGWLFAGPAGAAGAATGVGIVAASYLTSTYLIAWADKTDPALVLKVGMGAYVLKFSLIGIFMVWVSGTGWAGLPALGAGVVAGVVVWTGAQIWWITRHNPLPPTPYDLKPRIFPRRRRR